MRVRKGTMRLLVVMLATSGFSATAVVNPGAVSAAPPTCAQMAAAEPQAGHNMPPQANVLFATDFPKLTDCEWGYPLGGFGGIHQGMTLHHTPVIFVHGNQADAENWYLVADQFKQEAGYTDQELYALSYNGLQNGYAGLPTCCAPSPASQAYWACSVSVSSAQTGCPNAPGYEFCCNGGKGASDDPNVPDLYAFVQAVQAYTGSQQVDIVAHSLGVTITRKMLLLHPELRPDVLTAVMISGGNHGTSVCRGIESSYYGCEEISPLESLPPGTTTTGNPTPSNGWLYTLNQAGEAPGPTRWMSVYNGVDSTDPFFVAAPGVFNDITSPHLDGATNVTCAHTYHNDERVRPDIVHTYLQFVLQQGQAGGAQPGTVYSGPQPQFPCSVAQPPVDTPDAPMAVLLPLGGLIASGVTMWVRRRRSGVRAH
jgi:pimeloyl-ACP methyl ester carboxylesterase